MTERQGTASWARRLSIFALVLSLGGVAAALTAAVGTGTGLWPYSAGLAALRYALPATLKACATG